MHDRPAKLSGIFRFELGHQLRSVWFWLIFAALLVVAFLLTRDGSLAEALREDFFVNSPFSLAKVTVTGGLLWIVLGAAVAGEAAARDVATGIHPLMWTAPIRKTDYLAGRFLAALALNALLLLAVPAGAVLAIYGSGMDAASIGPFRPATYLTNYTILALPNAFFATALQFWLAARSGRPMAAYGGSFLLIFFGFFIASILFWGQEMAKLLDPIGVYFVLSEMSHMWTTWEKSWRLVTLEGLVLRNRLLWLGVGAGALALTWSRFRFAHPAEGRRWAPLRWLRGLRGGRPARADAPAPPHSGVTSSSDVSVPHVPRTFGLAIQARKTLAIGWSSFRTTAGSWAGLGILTVIPLLSILVVADQMTAGGARLLPNTILVLRELTGSLSDELSRWIFVPFIIVYFAGELVWRERDAGVEEISDAMPGSVWATLLGKLLGLGLLLALFLALIMAAGIAAQLLLGYPEPDLGLYLKALFGLQLVEYLLFVPLALTVHALVDQKYVGHLMAMMVYVVIALAPMFGIEHGMLIYGASPGWSYTHLRGFGPSLQPWLWFKAYWAAWALLLLVAARLFWVRGREPAMRMRLRNARRRLQGSTLALAGLAVVLVLTLGGFVFYNTNVLHKYRSSSDIGEIRAEYERRYGRYRDVPQPHLTETRLRVDIHPDDRAVDITGSYHLVNRTGAAIDSLHVTVVPGIETRSLTLSRSATLLPAVDDLPHRIYRLEEPLQPGDSMRMEFEVRVDPRGFSESGLNLSLAEEATTFDVRGWLPTLGYQASRELTSPADRREHGLPPRPQIPTLDDVEVRWDHGEGSTLDVVVGTRADQVAVAPGALRRSWTDGDRRYFRYVTDGPIGSEWTIASAAYDVRELRWQDPVGAQEDVNVRIYHHPDHTRHVDRLAHAIRASLDYYTREFGPYAYAHLTFVEVPAIGTGMHAAASLVTFTEGTAFWGVDDDSTSLDFPFAVAAHEMAHQWTVPSAFVEGAPVLSESLAWYYAMRVVEETYGSEVHRLLGFMRQPYPYPQIRRGQPLLRGIDPWMAYRKGPFALHALSEYLGDAPVNRALRRLVEEHETPGAPLATTLDLYDELQAVTPDSLQYLLHDLFEVNAFWELEAEAASAEPTDDGQWRVTLDVHARKVVVDSAGGETEVPLDEWIEVGVFAQPPEGEPELDAPLYVERHRIRSGDQTLTVTVLEQPWLAGIDPYHVLDWVEGGDDDNIVGVRVDG